MKLFGQEKDIYEHKFLFLSVILSFLFSIFLFFYVLFGTRFKIDMLTYTFFIPPVLTFFVYHIGIRLSDKFPKIIKIITALLNLIIILVLQIFFCIIIASISLTFQEDIEYTKVKDYPKALAAISAKDRILHFPKKIPKNVYNIELAERENSWFGSVEIYLYFETTQEYIEKELAKYEYKEIIGPLENIEDYGQFKHIHTEFIDKSGFKVYYITKQEGSGGYYGSGIAVKDNGIMYFYVCPD